MDKQRFIRDNPSMTMVGNESVIDANLLRDPELTVVGGRDVATLELVRHHRPARRLGYWVTGIVETSGKWADGQGGQSVVPSWIYHDEPATFTYQVSDQLARNCADSLRQGDPVAIGNLNLNSFGIKPALEGFVGVDLTRQARTSSPYPAPPREWLEWISNYEPRFNNRSGSLYRAGADTDMLFGTVITQPSTVIAEGTDQLRAWMWLMHERDTDLASGPPREVVVPGLIDYGGSLTPGTPVIVPGERHVRREVVHRRVLEGWEILPGETGDIEIIDWHFESGHGIYLDLRRGTWEVDPHFNPGSVADRSTTCMNNHQLPGKDKDDD